MGETVKHIAYTSGGVDAHGNPVEGFTDPVDVPNVAVAPVSTEESLASGVRVEDGITLYVEPGFACGPQDRFVVRGLTYEVAGSFLDWSNPFVHHRPGGTITLRRVTG